MLHCICNHYLELQETQYTNLCAEMKCILEKNRLIYDVTATPIPDINGEFLFICLIFPFLKLIDKLQSISFERCFSGLCPCIYNSLL